MLHPAIKAITVIIEACFIILLSMPLRTPRLNGMVSTPSMLLSSNLALRKTQFRLDSLCQLLFKLLHPPGGVFV